MTNQYPSSQLVKKKPENICPQILNNTRIFNEVLELLAKTIRVQKEIKHLKIGKQEVKLSMFSSNMVIYRKKCEHSTKRLLELVKIQKISGCKINTQKAVPFMMNSLKAKSHSQ